MAQQEARRGGSAQGFTLVEMVMAGSVALLVLSVGFPGLAKMKKEAELLDQLNGASFYLKAAQRSASDIGHPVVVEIDVERRELFGFANVDGDLGLTYRPDASVVSGAADYAVSRFTLPAGVPFEIAGPKGMQAVDGLEKNRDGKAVVVFYPGGTVRNPGGLRISDQRANAFELRLDTTGKVKILKYDPDPSWGGEAGFFPNLRDEETGASSWTWY